MANRHFGKLADVWKHLPLVEVLAIERPSAYWESHAGSPIYEVPTNDAEREYGAVRYFATAAGEPRLDAARYTRHLRDLNPAGSLTRYPGSAALAMFERGRDASYVVCDTDSGSAHELRDIAAALDVNATVAERDGMSVLHDQLASTPDPHVVLAHVDPYDPWATGPAGLSATDLAGELATAGVRVVYWYGYDRPDERAWAFDALAERYPGALWCGDVIVGDTRVSDGDLGDATSAGTGFGVALANVSAASVQACAQLGEALARVYAGATLPDGSPGSIDFATMAR